jgi:hypothetical protein
MSAGKDREGRNNVNLKDGKKSKNRGALVHLGYGNFVQFGRVVALLAANAAPAKRLREKAEKHGRLLNANAGHRTQALIVTDSNHVILCALSGEALKARLEESQA